MKQLLRRIAYLLTQRRRDAELVDEMEFHREMAARDEESRGPEARFGNTLRLREEARDAWGWTWIDRLSQDVRYALRALRRAPGFTASAIAMLAIGIGANVAAFSFFNLVALRPLPVRDPETLLRFYRAGTQRYASDVPYPAMAYYREHTRALSSVLASHATQLAMEGEAKAPSARFVTGDFLSELGGSAKLGRLLAERDDAPDAEPVIVLGYAFWHNHLGGDPGVVGKTIRLNGKPATVVGVAAREFSGPTMDAPALWIPLRRQPDFVHGSRLLTDVKGESTGVDMWGRLRPGVTRENADVELRMLAAELRALHPSETWEGEALGSAPGGYVRDVLTSSSGTGGGGPGRVGAEVLPVLTIVSALVLLILAVACGNLGSLLLARGVAREREVAIRIAVGAGTGRLVRQFFTESLVLAGLGSAAGILVGYAAFRGLMAVSAAPAWIDAAPDWRIVLFAVGVGFVAALFFGLTPALHVARQRHRASFSRRVLIGAQVAASCVLLIVSGLLVRALEHATSLDPGFEYKTVVSIMPRLGAHGYSSAAAHAYFDTFEARLLALPGVSDVALSFTPPLGRSKIVTGIETDGRRVNAYLQRVDPRFFATMKIPLLRGRSFTSFEASAVVVSESLARWQWPGEDAVGKLLPMGVDASSAPAQHTVVGVAGNARTLALKDADTVEVYLPVQVAELPGMSLLVRTSAAPELVAAATTRIAAEIDPNVLPDVQLMKVSFQSALEDTERAAEAIGLLGSIALLVACLGIAGLVSYAVAQHTKEIGIRLALGARPAHVVASIFAQFYGTVLAGLCVGVGAAALFSQLLRRELYGLSHLDPVSYATAVAVFVAVAVLAALVPARRALRVDPMRALRSE